MYRVPHFGPALVIAHRGGALLAPENSWESFENCDRLGFNLVESDAHLTSDGRVVLIHDPVLERVSDGFGPVALHTWDELQEVTINGSARGPVLLEDVLSSFPNLHLNLDAKEEQVWKPMVDVIRAHDATDRVLIASFDSARLRRVRRYAPELQTSMGQMEVARLFLTTQTAIIKRQGRVPLPKRGIVAAQVPLNFGKIPLVTKRFVATAHRLGVAVHVWTLNEPEEIVTALDMGVDGIITDHPVLAKEIIEARGRM
ncbi:MAG: glycerophosphodiester phosphodiesterase [Actinomycetaceae bacterium]|nr:glycerophosphodiester phosphodiesterase [Actinomycetaceae bacterium]